MNCDLQIDQHYLPLNVLGLATIGEALHVEENLTLYINV